MQNSHPLRKSKGQKLGLDENMPGLVAAYTRILHWRKRLSALKKTYAKDLLGNVGVKCETDTCCDVISKNDK